MGRLGRLSGLYSCPPDGSVRERSRAVRFADCGFPSHRSPADAEPQRVEVRVGPAGFAAANEFFQRRRGEWFSAGETVVRDPRRQQPAVAR